MRPVYRCFKNKPFLFVVLLSVFIEACQSSKVRQIPVHDFFKTPEKSNFKISPNGKYISYLKLYQQQKNLFVQNLYNQQETRITSFSDFPVHDYSWTFGNHLIFTQNSDKNPIKGKQTVMPPDQFKMYVLDIGNMKVRTLLTQDKASIRTIQTKNRQYPDIITITANKRDSATFDVYRINIRTGELQTYIINPGNITNWYPDQDGVIRLAKASDGVDESILFRTSENAPFKPIIKNNFKNTVEPIAFTGIKNSFYALSNVGRDKSALVEINAEDGKEVNVLFASDKADITDFGYSKSKRLMESVSWEAGKQQTHFLNSGMAAMYADMGGQLKGSKVKIIDRDSLEDKFVIYSYTDRDPGSYYIYEPAVKKLIKIGDLNPGLNPDELCEMQPVTFKASDGMLINGYLTLPKGPANTNLPLVVMPHNGPFTGQGSRNNWGYSPDVQFLANRGYAVFQLNYRGTTGYGKAFRSAGFKQVGGAIQQDITDGVNWLIAQKIANPKKVAIMGVGFGGFSALYGISYHPDLYNCAVVQSGLINYFTYMKDVPPFFKARQQMMYEMVGNPEADADQFMAISPVFHTDKIKSPLLMFQGGRDPHANISELNQFVRDLKRRKVPVTYILKDNERTFFSEKGTMQMYTEIERFLNNNMRVKP